MNRRPTLEEETFRRCALRKERLEPFGFVRQKDVWRYSEPFMNGAFRAEVYVRDDGQFYGRVMESDLDEEYLGLRLPNPTGYPAQVREEYLAVLRRIAEGCFERQDFVFPQSNRIASLILQRYGIKPEFLWEKTPECGVFRNGRSDRWFAIIMLIGRERLVADEEGEVEVMNLKLDDRVAEWLGRDGIYPAYHMNKKSWVSVALDETLSDEQIMELAAISFGHSDVRGEWLFPANPAYYDVIGAFEKSEIINWKQTGKVSVGDTVYLYVGQPYSAIMYGCEVLQTDIPYDYQDANLTIRKLMKIRLLKRYDPDRFSFRVLNGYGIRAIRGPRGVPAALSEALRQP